MSQLLSRKVLIILGSLFLFICSCVVESVDQEGKAEPSAVSLFGKALYPLAESEASSSKKDSLYQVALADFKNDSTDLQNIIWLGRRKAYQYGYKEAIDIYSRGIELYPEDPRLYRHRGHRYISIREFDKAIQDFEAAAKWVEGWMVEIEPDGQPNRLNIPLSTLQFNIYYHWALSYYLKGNFEKAAELYDICMAYSTNNDLLVATTDWYYMTLKRRGQDDLAHNLLDTISSDMEIIENTSYLRRLQMYKGLLPATELLDLNNQSEEAQLDIVTQGYGVANWHLYNGDSTEAMEIFQKIVECEYWPAFGYIAAEADLARLDADK